MFVRFPIILARPTSLRGSLSPGPWPQVIGRMPGGGKQNSGLSCFCCVSGATTMEKYPVGPAGRCALCVFQCLCCVLMSFLCPAVSPVCCPPHYADTRATQVPAGSGTSEPGSLRVLPSGQSRHCRLAQCCVPCLCCPPVSVLPSLSCLCPPIPILSSPSFYLHPSVPVLVPPHVPRASRPALPGLISPCSPSPACLDGQDTQCGEGF